MLAFNHIGHLGRLGNQMFQYASLRGIAARRGYDFGIPDSNFSDEWRTHQLFQVFDLVHLPKQNIRYLDGGNAPVASEKHFHFDQEFFDQCPNEVSIFGFFQSEKYFKHIEDVIRSDYTFKDDIVSDCKEIMDQVGDAIFLHVRRGDYVATPDHHPVQPIEYYEEALSRFDPDIPVLIFSDTLDWVREQKLFDGERFLLSENHKVEIPTID